MRFFFISLILLMFTENAEASMITKSAGILKNSRSLFKAIKPSKNPTTIIIEDFLSGKEVVFSKGNNYYFRKEFGQNIELEKNAINEKALSDNHFAITNREKNNKDNRIVVSQRHIFYNPLAEISIIYKLPDVEENITFTATGYRNSYHQLITAKHALSLSKEDIFNIYDSLNKNDKLSPTQINIKKYLETERHKFSFDPARISFKVSFGKINNEIFKNYQHIFGHRDTIVSDDPYDFGLIHLPRRTLDKFDEEIGSYAIEKLPLDKPKNQSLYATIIGYPAGKEGKLVYDAAEIIDWDFVTRHVKYLTDTTGGQSGSPCFKGNLKEFISKNDLDQIDQDNYPVIATHIKGLKGSHNIGQIHDDYILDLMEKNNRT